MKYLPVLAAIYALTTTPGMSDASNTEASRQSSGNCQTQTPTAGLPFSGGKVFSTLDEYLEYRRQLGMSDRPYYKKIAPDAYQLVAGRAGPREIYTRRQLSEQFGFVC